MYYIQIFKTFNKKKGPVFHDLSGKYTSITFIKVDVDECESVAAKAGVSAMPTFIIYRDGKKADEMVGASKDKLEELIKKYA